MKTTFKAKIRSVSLTSDPDKVKITLDSPEFRQSISWVEIEVPKHSEPVLGEELTVTIERVTS